MEKRAEKLAPSRRPSAWSRKAPCFRKARTFRTASKTVSFGLHEKSPAVGAPESACTLDAVKAGSDERHVAAPAICHPCFRPLGLERPGIAAPEATQGYVFARTFCFMTAPTSVSPHLGLSFLSGTCCAALLEKLYRNGATICKQHPHGSPSPAE